jgi:hypothetical protein
MNRALNPQVHIQQIIKHSVSLASNLHRSAVHAAPTKPMPLRPVACNSQGPYGDHAVDAPASRCMPLVSSNRAHGLCGDHAVDVSRPRTSTRVSNRIHSTHPSLPSIQRTILDPRSRIPSCSLDSLYVLVYTYRVPAAYASLHRRRRAKRLAVLVLPCMVRS